MKVLSILPVAAVLISSGSAAFAKDHPHGVAFIHAAVEGDNSETALGKLAARKGMSADTKAFGKMLAADHSKGRIEAAAVARKAHTFTPKSMSAEAIVEQQKLNRLTGKDFDREFASYMVKDHEDDIADFQAEANSSDPGFVKAFASKTLPTLQKHLDTAKRLDGAS